MPKWNLYMNIVQSYLITTYLYDIKLFDININIQNVNISIEYFLLASKGQNKYKS